jgi:hypothetical protein
MVGVSVLWFHALPHLLYGGGGAEKPHEKPYTVQHVSSPRQEVCALSHAVDVVHYTRARTWEDLQRHDVHTTFNKRQSAGTQM